MFELEVLLELNGCTVLDIFLISDIDIKRQVIPGTSPQTRSGFCLKHHIDHYPYQSRNNTDNIKMILLTKEYHSRNPLFDIIYSKM